ncbi:MAG: MTH865 family protein [Euryarchaeota archaeon]|nr:MTH865 family protein [Euryarchaeota archaeon]
MAEDPKLAYEDSLHGPLAELEKLKLEIVEIITGAACKFPVNNKSNLKMIFPPGTKMACKVGGKEVTFDKLADTLTSDDFPLEDAASVAAKILSRCTIE